jgi:hypothetical protein
MGITGCKMAGEIKNDLDLSHATGSVKLRSDNRLLKDNEIQNRSNNNKTVYTKNFLVMAFQNFSLFALRWKRKISKAPYKRLPTKRPPVAVIMFLPRLYSSIVPDSKIPG